MKSLRTPGGAVVLGPRVWLGLLLGLLASLAHLLLGRG
jgi:hypothetical protein